MVVVAVLAVLAGCSSAATPPAATDPYAAVRGVLLDPQELVPRTVRIDGAPQLPASAAGYVVARATEADLRALADAHTDGLSQPGTVTRSTTSDLTVFDTGDGSFQYYTEAFTNDDFGVQESWNWWSRQFSADEAAREASREPTRCPEGTAVPQAAARAFFGPLGLDVRTGPRMSCAGDYVTVTLEILVDGLPVVGLQASASIDQAGHVGQANGPLLRLEPLAPLPLAPIQEVLRRLDAGPGLVSGYNGCLEPCQLSASDAGQALALVETGGIGEFDHFPGHAVPGGRPQLLLPALRVTSAGTDLGPTALDTAVLAVSSAVLVDDPVQADAARLADASTDPAAGPACGGDFPRFLALCSSTMDTPVGTPVLVTVAGQLAAPEDCDPTLTLDVGDGSPLTSFTPRAGTLVTGRIAHAFADPGEYTLTARVASGCPGPLTSQPGDPFSPYDSRTTLVVTVGP